MKIQRQIKKNPFVTLGIPFLGACVFGSFALAEAQRTKYLSPSRSGMLFREEDIAREQEFNLDKELEVPVISESISAWLSAPLAFSCGSFG